MTPFERGSIEASRRIQVLPTELADWLAASQANIDGLGIHRSQLLALQGLMATLTNRQQKLLAARPQPAATKDYAEAELELTDEIVGSYELWNVFRAVLEQRRQGRLSRSLDAADLVVASAYRTAIEQAEGWGVVQPGAYREPPLVCAEAVGSPATAARGKQVAGLAGTIKRYREKLLPIPLVLFPADRLDDIWTFATLAHEVGHDLAADLAYSSEATAMGIAALEAVNAPPEHIETWRAWGPEVAADAVGVALAGAGFATGLADWLQSVALAEIFTAPSGDPHPPPHVRLHVLAALLESTNEASWIPIAAQLSAAAGATPVPEWQQPFQQEAAPFASAMMTVKLGALLDHAIVELSPSIAADAAATQKLSTWLRTGFNRDPSPKVSPPFPTRLVPSAAMVAVTASPASADVSAIARRSLDYIHDIPRPQFLTPPPRSQRAFLQKLSDQLDVRPTANDA